MKLIYIAGAFSADTDDGRAANIAAAKNAGAEVMKLGAGILVPHLALCPYYGQIPESAAMEICREYVRRCDAVYIFDERHYASSRGTHEEAMLAHSLRIPVFVSFARLKAWLEERAKVYGIGEVVLGRVPRSFNVGKDLPWEKTQPPR